ncbi:Flp family type IVb pilin [Rhodobium gokarnense]|uniref:Flp pilus assembly protein TadG n=1 Tax=Rhodobium gokarnense TaxID=364296 RepID=A0ABT3H8R6_9HYPH|nr:hypothetical protein [Rhodobium gokarnense]MCW2306797.1 Flp pilus assembly protein TadG [Rhodobium gokarnense]
MRSRIVIGVRPAPCVLGRLVFVSMECSLMGRFLSGARRFWRDERGMGALDFALISASLAMALSVGLLALGLGIQPAKERQYAEAPDGVDMLITGSITAARKDAATAPSAVTCPQLPPVILRR